MNILLKLCISYENILLKLYVSYEKYSNFANFHLECTYYMHTFLFDGLKRNETKAEKVGSKFLNYVHHFNVTLDANGFGIYKSLP